VLGVPARIAGSLEKAGPVTRRFDPQRRDHIIDAALRVIVSQGVAGTSHRKVAVEAGVPLGSMTYHFSGMDELLREAFARFSDGVAVAFEGSLAAAGDAGEVKAAIVETINENIFESRESLILTLELYALAARDERFRDLTTSWMGRSRRALERHFDPRVARELDALVEGLTIHRALDVDAQDPGLAADSVEKITRSGPAR
jgi:DNA-binding transcriptional regulator YbjK